MSPRSLEWGSQTSLNRLPQNTNRYSDQTNDTGHMSPISDGAYSNVSSVAQAPARPPKEPIAPERPPKIRTGKLQKPSPLSNEHLNADTHSYGTSSPGANEQGGSPARSIPTALGVPARKPAGPRSISSASKSGELNRDDGTVKRNKNRGILPLPSFSFEYKS